MRGREGGREGEKHGCVRDTLIRCLLHTPNRDLACNPGMCLNRESGDLSVCRAVLNPLSPTSQVYKLLLKLKIHRQQLHYCNSINIVHSDLHIGSGVRTPGPVRRWYISTKVKQILSFHSYSCLHFCHLLVSWSLYLDFLKHFFLVFLIAFL